MKFIEEKPVKYGDKKISKEDFREIAFDNVSFGYENQEGLKLLIQERGTNLSGGEKRRITLARTMLRKTPF